MGREARTCPSCAAVCASFSADSRTDEFFLRTTQSGRLQQQRSLATEDNDDDAFWRSVAMEEAIAGEKESLRV